MTSRQDGFVRRNALSLTCFGIFGVLLVAQSITGWRSSVADAIQHGGEAIGYWTYLTTGHFGEATFENWESEFLQMGAFVLLTDLPASRRAPASRSRRATTRATRIHAAIATTPTRRGRSGAAGRGSSSTRTAC